MNLLTYLRYTFFGPPFCARDLQRRTRIRLDGKVVTVSAVEFCDGKDGRPHRLISFNDKTAVGLRVQFFEREPVIIHPGVKMSRA
jgi:hypothetical protein